MKRIFLLILAAVALAGNVQAEVDQHYALICGDSWAAAEYETDLDYHIQPDPEHIENAQHKIRDLQSSALMSGAQSPEEIDQFVYVAWHEMYLKLKLLISVEGHPPIAPLPAS